ncbi:MAG TPA: isoleucine--tRNA ligase [Thermoplasmata archaeon]|nr:isoleucine--tRNA ligase [Thermoplasmata archaeon]
MPAEEPEFGAPSSRAVQERVAAYWEATGVVARSLTPPAEGPLFRFTEGPPTANGPPHLGHLIARVFKDLTLRYHRMNGERVVSSMAGWDCHGLPVEVEIEKSHGLKSKKEIEAYGVDRFCDECRTSALAVAEVWREMSRRLGYWLDYEHAYRTMDPSFMESVWWSLRQLFDQGLLEKGHYVLPYCPRCETPLASHEVAQGYRETTDPSVTLRLTLTDPAYAHRELLVWTTTPWTLPANLLVAARADLEYSVVRIRPGEDVVLASAAIPRYFPEPPDVVERLPGSALAGWSYAPPFDFAGPGPGRYRVVLGDFVTAEEGTGLVHVAPSFGPDDQRLGAREKVGVFDPLDNRGVFGDAVPLVRGKGFKSADHALLRDLSERGLVFRSETVRHTYPFCWRCDTPLLYRAIDSWFVRTSRFTQNLVRNNATVHWIPAHLRDGRFGNFLTEAKDWALSRNRYWGTPLPIWLCPTGHATCVGSFEELGRLSGTPLPAGFDPHRVQVDRIVFPCPKCGAPSRREPYTIDAWYDAGSAPFAQYHYPFEPGPFEPDRPLDYIAEGLDQTRGWFYTLLVISTALFSRPAYRTCLTTGLVLDDSGRKMSKSKGNALSPLELLERLGADPIRWMFLSVDFTEPMRVGEATIHKTAARTLGTLGNVVAFHLQNARPDGLDPATTEPAVSALLDRWLLSRLEATREVTTAALDTGDPRPAAVSVRELVDDLSTWYVRRSRPRFWGETGPEDRRAAHDTLSYALLGLARITAPLIPFTAEWVHHEVGEHEFEEAEDSVHLQRWPDRLAARDRELEAGMARLRALVEVGRELRHRAEVKSRIPLEELVLFGEAEPVLRPLGDEGTRLLAEELNVRRVRRLPALDRTAFPESEWVLREEEGRPVAALPRHPTPELREEGLAREVGRRLQHTRRELGLDPSDRVRISVGASGELLGALRRWKERLTHDLLADAFDLVDGELPASPDVRRWDLDGAVLTATVARVGP